MSSSGAGYDLSPTTFSPDGRIFQVEYASKAVENSSTALGVRCSDGVVMAVEKLLMSKLLVPGSNRRLQTVDKHTGIAITGLVADGRQLVNRARSECQGFEDAYNYHIPPDVLCNRLSEYVHYFTLHGSLRPFGSACILASYDEELKTHQLHMIEPSGLSFRYFGCALGKGRQSAKTEIEKLKLNEMTCRQALKEIAKIIHTLHDESKDKPFELEMSWLCEESAWQHQIVPQALVTEAEETAKKELEDMDEDDD